MVTVVAGRFFDGQLWVSEADFARAVSDSDKEIARLLLKVEELQEQLRQAELQADNIVFELQNPRD